MDERVLSVLTSEDMPNITVDACTGKMGIGGNEGYYKTELFDLPLITVNVQFVFNF